jgi:hypothetical protein
LGGSKNQFPPLLYPEQVEPERCHHVHGEAIWIPCHVSPALSLIADDFPKEAAYRKRQWERKANQWKFFKYERPETRFKQIEAGQSGDRNLSRFVRRHRSPSPCSARQAARSHKPRSKSTSAIGSPGYEYIDPAYLHAGDSHLSPQPATFPDSFTDLETAQSYDPAGSMLNDITYNISMASDVYQNLTNEVPPDHFKLDATRANTDSESPIQLHIVSDPNAAGPPPEVHLTMYDDYSAQLLPPVALDLNNHIGTAPHYEDTAQSAWVQFELKSPHGQELNGEGYRGSQPATQLSSPSRDVAATYVDDVNSFKNAAATVSPLALDMTFLDQSIQAMAETEHSRLNDEDDDVMGSFDPHRLDTDFMLRVSDYTKSVKKTVMAFARANNANSSDIEKLKAVLNDTREPGNSYCVIRQY